MTAAESTHGKPRILVADDESVIAMQIGELIEAEGYALAGVASNAVEAVDMARALRPDLVLMDIVMPGRAEGPTDGIDACAEIQRDLDIPVVLLTAHGEEQFLRRARTALPSAYLLKPCQNTQIRAAIEVALALRVHNNPAAGFRLREAHHRIKNSFSLLHSMLRLQELQATDAQARHALADAGARVLALARSHETMAVGDPQANSDGRGHVERLARSLFDAQAPAPPRTPLTLTLELEQLSLHPAQVIPCGIFLAEAMTNAIKHAFPDGQSGSILVSLRKEDGHGVLAVTDDGVGLPDNLAEFGRQSFGLQCLQAAAEQLEGALGVSSGPEHGAVFSVRFPLISQVYQSRSA